MVRLPRISNFDDFDPLDHEPGVALRFVGEAEALAGADLVILPAPRAPPPTWPGCAAPAWPRPSPPAPAGASPLLGICGGCQMLGLSIEDPDGLESPEPSVDGLGLLPIRTRFRRDKLTAQVKARPGAAPASSPRAWPPPPSCRLRDPHGGGGGGRRRSAPPPSRS